MLLTVSLLNKGSLLGSFINKCRQVVRIKNVKPIETNLTPNISTSPTGYADIPPQINTNTNANVNSNRPLAVAHLSLSTPSSSRTLEEKVGMPPRPKKPLTPYFRFLKEQRNQAIAANPQMNTLEIVKQVATKWRTTDEALKQRLQEEYKKEQQKYLEVRTKYDATVTDEQRRRLKELKQEIQDAKQRNLMRKRIVELGKPRKPASAFFKFLAKERVINPQGAKETFTDYRQKAADKWKTLTDQQRNEFMQETRKELEVYKKELLKWEEKMIRMGNVDVVRHGNLIDPPEPKPKKR